MGIDKEVSEHTQQSGGGQCVCVCVDMSGWAQRNGSEKWRVLVQEDVGE